MDDKVEYARRAGGCESDLRDQDEARLGRSVLWLCLLNTLFGFLYLILWLPFFVTSMVILRLVWKNTHMARSWLALIWTAALWYWACFDFSTTSLGFG